MARNQENFEITQFLMDTYPIDPDLTPSEFIVRYWDYYERNYRSKRTTNGKIFENLIILALAREGIEPIYYQTALTYVPTALFDVVLYERDSHGNEKPIALSIKTSLRERWKQADLEAAALKQVHKEAECYLLSRHDTEIDVRKRQEAPYAGLDNFISVNGSDFDEFVAYLSTKTFVEAGYVPVIQSSDRVYDDDDLWSHFHFRM